MSAHRADPRPGDRLGSPASRFRLLPAPPGERRLDVPAADLRDAAAGLLDEGARPIARFTTHTPESAVVTALALRGEIISLVTPFREGEKPSLADLCPGLAWAERVPATVDVDRLDRHTRGPEAFVIPYGPIRSGIFEAIGFTVETGGEDVLALDVRTFFKHRALERRFAGVSAARGAVLAERVAGISSVAHAIAFAEATERALGVEAPRRAALWRTIHAELERIANHLDVAAKLAEDAALAVGQARFLILKEDVLRLRAALTGSRFARGVVVPGGIHAEASISTDELRQAVSKLERALARDRRLFIGTTSMIDRLIGAGRLDRATVEAFGGVGPVARATGVATDARFERPYAGYRWLGFTVVTREEGDSMARMHVRFGEIVESLHLVRQAMERLHRADPELRVALPTATGDALGWSEAAQGELVYRVAVRDGVIDEVAIASPSFRDWPLFAESFRGDVLTDFSFIEHSFGLTPAGADR